MLAPFKPLLISATLFGVALTDINAVIGLVSVAAGACYALLKLYKEIKKG